MTKIQLYISILKELFWKSSLNTSLILLTIVLLFFNNCDGFNAIPTKRTVAQANFSDDVIDQELDSTSGRSDTIPNGDIDDTIPGDASLPPIGEIERTDTVKRTEQIDEASKPSPPPIQSIQNGIVYVRVPRTQGPVNIIGGDQIGGTKKAIVQAPDAWDVLPDSRNTLTGFNAPGQLVYLPPGNANEKILFDCVGKSRVCVPLDPTVSLDGKEVIFAVYWSDDIGYITVGATTLPNTTLGKINLNSQIFIVNIATGALKSWPLVAGVHDMSPIWLPNGRIMFSSTRGKTAPPWLRGMSASSLGQPQLYTAKPDGTDVINISPHELATAIHPFLTKGGSVVYSSFWTSHNLAFVATNGGINWPTTLGNMWMISDINIEGGDTTAVLGAHRARGVKFLNLYPKNLKALHFLGQRENNDVCVANYYRANNLGLGDIFCWTPEAKGVEGRPRDFLPNNFYDVARWATSDDDLARTNNKPKGTETYFGKLGYPEGVANNQIMLTFGQGFCLTNGGSLASRDKLASYQPNKRACDVGIYRTTRVPSDHPQDLLKIVDSPNYHEFSARAVVTKSIAKVTIPKVKDNRCIIASSDAGTHELSPHLPYKFNYNYKTAANNGGKIAGLDHAQLYGIRFWEVIPNRGKKPKDDLDSIGNKLKLLGDVPLLSDRSFVAELPCDTPYLMGGIDKEGRVIMRDQIPQSLRPGEERVCSGCHAHSSDHVGRPYKESMAYTAFPVDLKTATPVPVFNNDMEKVFARRCISCHTGTPIAENFIPFENYNLLVWDFLQKSVPKTKKILVNSKTGNQDRRYGLHRPYTSKYVNNMFARESLLYWKAAGKRTDGRLDSTYNETSTTPNDIDYGSLKHPTTGITPLELRRLSLWLDSGAPRK